MDLDKLLIREVKNHCVLYDPSHWKYKDLVFKQQTWIEIGRKLIGCEDDTTSGTVNALKVRWKSLRDAYVKQRKYDISKNCGLNVREKRPWRLKKEMEFLAPFIQNRKDLFIDISCKDDSVCNDDISDIRLSPSPPIVKENLNGLKPIANQSDSSVILQKCRKFSVNKDKPNPIHHVSNPQNEYVIEIESFFRGISEAVKGLNRKHQLLVQKEVASLVMNYKLQELEEEDDAHS